MANIILKNSRALHYFKDLIGQNNHFLITVLVGLDEVAKGTATLGEEFRTSWNPQDERVSALRSRHFAIKATLSWIVDSIDSYFTLTNRVPKLIQNVAFNEKMYAAGQRVSSKLDVFRSNVDCLDVEYAMIKLAITWRNRLVHNFADNELLQDARRILTEDENREYIKENYRGLLIDEALRSFDSSYKNVPKFKEITAFVSASVRFMTDIDEKLVISLDVNEYMKQIIFDYILGDSDLNVPNDKDSRLKRIEGIWTKDDQIKKRKLLNIFSQYGCMIQDGNEWLDDLSKKSFKEAKTFFNLDN